MAIIDYREELQLVRKRQDELAKQMAYFNCEAVAAELAGDVERYKSAESLFLAGKTELSGLSAREKELCLRLEAPYVPE